MTRMRIAPHCKCRDYSCSSSSGDRLINAFEALGYSTIVLQEVACEKEPTSSWLTFVDQSCSRADQPLNCHPLAIGVLAFSATPDGAA
jgi:uncharacterized protein (DUF3084 family)